MIALLLLCSACCAPLARVGLLTDTHVTANASSCERIRQAYRLFRTQQVAVIANLGDIADHALIRRYHVRTGEEIAAEAPWRFDWPYVRETAPYRPERRR